MSLQGGLGVVGAAGWENTFEQVVKPDHGGVGHYHIAERGQVPAQASTNADTLGQGVGDAAFHHRDQRRSEPIIEAAFLDDLPSSLLVGSAQAADRPFASKTEAKDPGSRRTRRYPLCASCGRRQCCGPTPQGEWTDTGCARSCEARLWLPWPSGGSFLMVLATRKKPFGGLLGQEIMRILDADIHLSEHPCINRVSTAGCGSGPRLPLRLGRSRRAGPLGARARRGVPSRVMPPPR